MNTIAILVDDLQTQSDFSRALEPLEDFRLVATAQTLHQALVNFPPLNPSIVLIDILLKRGENGSDCLHTIRTKLPKATLIVTTVVSHPNMLFQCFRRGADAYTLKKDFFLDPMPILQRILRGETLMTPSVRKLFNEDIDRLPPAFWESLVIPGQELLTPKESSILKLAAQALKNKEIDALLGLGKDTSRKSMGTIQQKLGAIDRSEAILFFRNALCEWDH